MEVWWADLDQVNKKAASDSWSKGGSEGWDGNPSSDGWVAGSPDTSALKMVEKWLKRRSDEDVSAFKAWFNDMYEQDRGVGMKMLDWDLSPQQLQHLAQDQQPPSQVSRLFINLS